MRLISLHIFKFGDQNSILISSKYNVTHYPMVNRAKAIDALNNFARSISGQTMPGTFQLLPVDNNIGKCYCLAAVDGIQAVAIVDNDYY